MDSIAPRLPHRFPKGAAPDQMGSTQQAVQRRGVGSGGQGCPDGFPRKGVHCPGVAPPGDSNGNGLEPVVGSTRPAYEVRFNISAGTLLVAVQAPEWRDGGVLGALAAPVEGGGSECADTVITPISKASQPVTGDRCQASRATRAARGDGCVALVLASPGRSRRCCPALAGSLHIRGRRL